MSDELKKSSTAQRQREKDEPLESNRPLPWFLIMSLGALAMWGAFYIASTPSGDDSAYGDQRTVTSLRPAVLLAGAAPAVDGKQLYGAKCAACHQGSGLGVAGVFPPVAASEWVLGDEKILANILLHGVNGEMVVKGSTYKGAMPAWNTLGDDEIAAVLTYIRSDWGNAAPPVKAETIKSQRELTKARTEPYAGGSAIKPDS
jgi:mono/diheme cytochrome c family protein